MDFFHWRQISQVARNLCSALRQLGQHKYMRGVIRASVSKFLQGPVEVNLARKRRDIHVVLLFKQHLAIKIHQPYA